MSREHEERDMVAILATAQARKLREPQNRAKGTWHAASAMELMKALEAELRELAGAVLAADWGDPVCVAAVVSECADVANFAGMICQNAKEGRWKRQREREPGAPE